MEIYIVKCPECGEEFEVQKGVLVKECSKTTPKERLDETPFNCPKCNHTISVLDDDFNDHASLIALVD